MSAGWGLRCALTFLIAWACLCTCANAATITVNTTEDLAEGGGVCSLREAVISANDDKAPTRSDCVAGTKGGNTIELEAKTYKLKSDGELEVTEPLTIAGASMEHTSILQEQPEHRVIEVDGAALQIANLTIKGGSGGSSPEDENGGGILVDERSSATIANVSLFEDDGYTAAGGIYVAARGRATVEHSSILKDLAGDGGGIYVAAGGAAVIEDSTIDDDLAGEYGGGVYVNAGGEAMISGSTLHGDEVVGYYGGGIYTEGAMTVTDTTITDNEADAGGGLGLEAAAAKLTNDRILENTARAYGGGIFAVGRGRITLTNSSVARNIATGKEELGGGIYADDDPAGIDIEGSTIGPDNYAARGDGVALQGAPGEATITQITRSTIAENGDDQSELGGGLFAGEYVEATMHDVTVAQNGAGTKISEGGDVYAQAHTTLTWQNSLIATDREGANCEVPAKADHSLGGTQAYGLYSNACHLEGITTNDVEDEVPLESSELSELHENGGPTETMALAAKAPPVGTGFGCEHTDQRGVVRPPDSCDAGAYQVDPPPPVLSITYPPSENLYEVVEPTLGFTFTSSSAEEPTSFQCSLDKSAFAPCASPFLAGPLTFATHTFTVKALDTADDLGGEAARTFTIVKSEPTCACAARGPEEAAHKSSPLAPVLSGLSQSASRWRAGTGLAHLSTAPTKLPRGTTFSFTLNEAASVHLAFTQAASGRMVAGHCRPPSRRNARKRACRRTVTVGTLALAAPAGADRVRFEGRLSASRKLKPGRYTLVASATAGGLTSVPRSLTFTILGA